MIAAPRGHRELDHTADIAFEAWGPRRGDCFAEAVTALVASFVDTRDAAGGGEHRFTLAGADHEDVLVDLLDEVLYLLDARGQVPVEVALDDRDDGGLDGRFTLAAVDRLRVRGAIPKAITYHGLAVARTDDGWLCRVTVDV